MIVSWFCFYRVVQSFHHCFVQNAISFDFNVNIIEQ